MYEDFFIERLTELRMHKGVSARDMSLSLGQSESYINKIENGKSFPSMQIFFYICEYFDVSPKDFFEDAVQNPVAINEIIVELNKLNKDDFSHLLYIAKRLTETD